MRRLPSIFVTLAVVCAGCGDDPAPAAPSRPPRPAAAPQLAAADAAQQAADAAFRYDPTDKRDPFRSYVRTNEGEDGFQTPLERFDLTQLTVTAIVWGTGDSPRALIRDPAGKGYIVTPGMIVGKNKGRIIAIEDNSIKVKETYVDALGRAATKAVELRLREGVGG